MCYHKSQRRLCHKLIALVTASLFFLSIFTSDVFALAPQSATLNPAARCEYHIACLLRSGTLKFAETSGDIAFIEGKNHAKALLLSHGKILAHRDLKDRPQELLRAIIHEEVEAIMQIMAAEEGTKYSKLISMVLGPEVTILGRRLDLKAAFAQLFPEEAKSCTTGGILDNELLANHMVAKAWELILARDQNLLSGTLTPEESIFLGAIGDVINHNRHNYFTDVFWDARARESKIRAAQANGMSFVQAASSRERSRREPEFTIDSMQTLLRRHFGNRRVIRGLDYGPSTGRKTGEMLSILKAAFPDAGVEYVGLERDSDKVRLAKRDGKPVILMPVEDAVQKYGARSQDIVTIFVPMPSTIPAFIESARRVVKKDGLIAISLGSADMDDLMAGRKVFLQMEAAELWELLKDFTLIRVGELDEKSVLTTHWLFIYSPQGIDIARLDQAAAGEGSRSPALESAEARAAIEYVRGVTEWTARAAPVIEEALERLQAGKRRKAKDLRADLGIEEIMAIRERFLDSPMVGLSHHRWENWRDFFVIHLFSQYLQRLEAIMDDAHSNKEHGRDLRVALKQIEQIDRECAALLWLVEQGLLEKHSKYIAGGSLYRNVTADGVRLPPVREYLKRFGDPAPSVALAPIGTPAQLLREMHAAGVFDEDSAKTSRELAGNAARGGDADSRRTIQRELRYLQDAGLVEQVDGKYHLAGWLRNIKDIETFIAENPTLNKASPAADELEKIRGKVGGGTPTGDTRKVAGAEDSSRSLRGPKGRSNLSPGSEIPAKKEIASLVPPKAGLARNDGAAGRSKPGGSGIAGTSIDWRLEFERLAAIYGGKGAWYKILEKLQAKLGLNLLPSTYATIKDAWGLFYQDNRALFEYGNSLVEADMAKLGSLSPETETRLKKIIRHLTYSKELRKLVGDNIKDLNGANIVRSSGRFEDSFLRNLAGIFISPIRQDERLVNQAVRETFRQAVFAIWLHSAGDKTEDSDGMEALSSALKDVPRKITAEDGVGLVIQGFFNFDASGTAMSNMHGFMSIEAVPGDAAFAVRSPHANVATYLFDKENPDRYEYNPAFLNTPYEFTLRGKPYSVGQDIDELRAALDGYPKIDGRLSPLSDAQAKELNRKVTELEKEIGVPVDVEWGFLDGKLYIIQVRPMVGDLSKPLVEKSDRLKERLAKGLDRAVATTPIALGQTAPDGFTGKAVVFGSVAMRETIAEFEKKFGKPYIRIQFDVATKILDSKGTIAKVIVDPVQGSRQAHNLANLHERIGAGEFAYANGPILRDGLAKNLTFVPHPELRGVWVSVEDVTYFSGGLKGEFYVGKMGTARLAAKPLVHKFPDSLNPRQELLAKFHERVKDIWHTPFDLINYYNGYHAILRETVFLPSGIAADAMIGGTFQQPVPSDIRKKIIAEIKGGQYSHDSLMATQPELRLLEEALSNPLYPEAWESRLMGEMQKILIYKDTGDGISEEELLVQKKPHDKYRAYIYDFHDSYSAIEAFLRSQPSSAVERVDALEKRSRIHLQWEKFTKMIEDDGYEIDFLLVHIGSRDYAADISRLCYKVRRLSPNAIIIVEGRLPDDSIAGMANQGDIELYNPKDFSVKAVIEHLRIMHAEWVESQGKMGTVPSAHKASEGAAQILPDPKFDPKPIPPETMRFVHVSDDEEMQAEDIAVYVEALGLVEAGKGHYVSGEVEIFFVMVEDDFDFQKNRVTGVIEGFMPGFKKESFKWLETIKWLKDAEKILYHVRSKGKETAISVKAMIESDRRKYQEALAAWQKRRDVRNGTVAPEYPEKLRVLMIEDPMIAGDYRSFSWEEELVRAGIDRKEYEFITVHNIRDAVARIGDGKIDCCIADDSLIDCKWQVLYTGEDVHFRTKLRGMFKDAVYGMSLMSIAKWDASDKRRRKKELVEAGFAKDEPIAIKGPVVDFVKSSRARQLKAYQDRKDAWEGRAGADTVEVKSRKKRVERKEELTELPEPKRPEKLRVLVVDDEPSWGTNVSNVLPAAEYGLIFAKDWEVALKELSQGDGYDLVLFDIQFPGFENIRSVLKNMPNIVACSCCDDVEARIGIGDDEIFDRIKDRIITPLSNRVANELRYRRQKQLAEFKAAHDAWIAAEGMKSKVRVETKPREDYRVVIYDYHGGDFMKVERLFDGKRSVAVSSLPGIHKLPDNPTDEDEWNRMHLNLPRMSNILEDAKYDVDVFIAHVGGELTESALNDHVRHIRKVNPDALIIMVSQMAGDRKSEPFIYIPRREFSEDEIVHLADEHYRKWLAGMEDRRALEQRVNSGAEVGRINKRPYPAPRTPEKAVVSPEPQRPSKLRVLVIDDNAIHTNQMEKAIGRDLPGSEYSVKCVENANDAIAKLAEADKASAPDGAFDLIVCDILLPNFKSLEKRLQGSRYLVLSSAHNSSDAYEASGYSKLFRRNGMKYYEKTDGLKAGIMLLKQFRLKQLDEFSDEHQRWEERYGHLKPGAPEPVRPAKLKLLVAGDAVPDTADVEDELGSGEYELLWAGTYEDAFKILMTEGPDAVVFDWGMKYDYVGSGFDKDVVELARMAGANDGDEYIDVFLRSLKRFRDVTLVSEAKLDKAERYIMGLWEVNSLKGRIKVLPLNMDGNCVIEEARQMRERQLAEYLRVRDEWEGSGSRDGKMGTVPILLESAPAFDPDPDKVPVDPAKPTVFVLTESTEEAQEVGAIILHEFGGRYNVMPMGYFMYLERMLDKRAIKPDIVITYDEMTVLGEKGKTKVLGRVLQACRAKNADVKFVVLSDEAATMDVASLGPDVVGAIEMPFYYQEIVEAVNQLAGLPVGRLTITNDERRTPAPEAREVQARTIDEIGSEPARPEKLRVLIVDNDIIGDIYFKDMLKRRFVSGGEYEIEYARNWSEAKVHLSAGTWHHIFIDYTLGLPDGWSESYLYDLIRPVGGVSMITGLTEMGVIANEKAFSAEKYAVSLLKLRDEEKRNIEVMDRMDIYEYVPQIISEARQRQLEEYTKAHDAREVRKRGKPEVPGAGSVLKERMLPVGHIAELPPDASKEWTDFMVALNEVGGAAGWEFAEMAGECEKMIVDEKKAGRSLVLYADDIVERVAVYDLQHTIKNVLARHGVLAGGKVVLFVRKASNAKILGDMIRAADPSIATVTIDEARVGPVGDEVRELDKVVRFARAEGAKDIMAIIKGPILDADETEPLKAFAMESKIPLVVLGRGENIYSFAQAIAMAISAKQSNGTRTGWLIMLPAVRSVTEDIRAEYDAYKSALEALRAA